MPMPQKNEKELRKKAAAKPPNKKGVSKPRFQPAQVRVDDLLNAGEVVLLKRGAVDLTIDEVVEKAEVAKGTFYLYFKSKDDLVKTLQKRFAERFLRRHQELMTLERPKNSYERLDAWVKCAWLTNNELSKLHDLLFLDFHYHLDNDLLHSIDIVVDSLAQILDQGSKDGSWAIKHPRLTAIFLFNAFHGVVDQGISHGLSFDELVVFTQGFFQRVVGKK